MMQHTPTPWVTDTDGNGKGFAIVTSTHDKDGPDDDVCEVYGGNGDDDETREANARLIVRAVNSHASLVAALESTLEAYRLSRSQVFGTDAIETQARAALALAKGA